MKKTGAQLILEVLLEHGVDTVFGYPGGAALNVYDALYEYQDRIKHILTAHEQGASHAADGYARATGKTGVVFATSGPGATNLVTGIATAYMDSVPMVAITSNVTNNLIGRDAFQEVYITGITMQGACACGCNKRCNGGTGGLCAGKTPSPKGNAQGNRCRAAGGCGCNQQGRMSRYLLRRRRCGASGGKGAACTDGNIGYSCGTYHDGGRSGAL